MYIQIPTSFFCTSLHSQRNNAQSMLYFVDDLFFYVYSKTLNGNFKDWQLIGPLLLVSGFCACIENFSGLPSLNSFILEFSFLCPRQSTMSGLLTLIRANTALTGGVGEGLSLLNNSATATRAGTINLYLTLLSFKLRRLKPYPLLPLFFSARLPVLFRSLSLSFSEPFSQYLYIGLFFLPLFPVLLPVKTLHSPSLLKPFRLLFTSQLTGH